jgi:ABC-type lipoprotein export system ATPase subunit
MTVVDLALGLVPPTSGQIRFLGRSWHRLTPLEASAVRRRLGWISQRPVWLSNLDLDENILLVSRYHGDGNETTLQARMDDLAERFGLSRIPRARGPYTDETTRRRCGWIRALMPRPRVILVGTGVAANIADARLLAKVLTTEPERPQALLWIASEKEVETVRTHLTPSQSLAWDPGGSTDHE